RCGRWCIEGYRIFSTFKSWERSPSAQLESVLNLEWERKPFRSNLSDAANLFSGSESSFVGQCTDSRLRESGQCEDWFLLQLAARADKAPPPNSYDQGKGMMHGFALPLPRESR